MFAKDLVGKWALRTRKTRIGDNSYTSSPIFIEGVTVKDIIYRYKQIFNGKLSDTYTLGTDEWNDENWMEAKDPRKKKVTKTFYCYLDLQYLSFPRLEWIADSGVETTNFKRIPSEDKIIEVEE